MTLAGIGQSAHRYPGIMLFAVSALLVLTVVMAMAMATALVVGLVSAASLPWGIADLFTMSAPVLAVALLAGLLLRFLWRLRQHMRAFRLELGPQGFRVGADPLVPWDRLVDAKVHWPLYASFVELRAAYRDASGRLVHLRFNSWIDGFGGAKAAFLGRGAAPTLKP